MNPTGRGPVGRLERGATFGMTGLDAISLEVVAAGCFWWMVMCVRGWTTLWLDWAKKTGGLRFLRPSDSRTRRRERGLADEKTARGCFFSGE
jgi:hypothetical protein